MCECADCGGLASSHFTFPQPKILQLQFSMRLFVRSHSVCLARLISRRTGELNFYINTEKLLARAHNFELNCDLFFSDLTSQSRYKTKAIICCWVRINPIASNAHKIDWVFSHLSASLRNCAPSQSQSEHVCGAAKIQCYNKKKTRVKSEKCVNEIDYDRTIKGFDSLSNGLNKAMNEKPITHYYYHEFDHQDKTEIYSGKESVRTLDTWKLNSLKWFLFVF